jgi:hypothetical protein
MDSPRFPDPGFFLQPFLAVDDIKIDEKWFDLILYR